MYSVKFNDGHEILTLDLKIGTDNGNGNDTGNVDFIYAPCTSSFNKFHPKNKS